MSQYKFTIVGKDATKRMFASIKAGLGGVRSAVNSTQVKFAALAGVAGIGAMVNANREAIDVLAKTSDKLGIATEELAGLRHAAELTGNSQKNLDLGLQRMTRRISEAAQGSGVAAGALTELGLSATDLAKMTPDEQFRQLADAFQQVDSQGDKVRLGFKLFDTEGVNLINTLELGSEGLRETAAEADALGLALTRVEAAQVEEANDSLLRVGQAVKGLGQQVTVKLAPAISVAAEKLVGFATEGDRMSRVIDAALKFAVKGVGIFADGLRGLQVIVKGVQIAFEFWKIGVMGVFKIVTEAAIMLGQTIVNAVTAPLKGALEIAAKFSDSAGEMLADLQQFTQIEEPEFLAAIDAGMRSSADNATRLRGEMQGLLLADLPSAVIEQKWAEIQEEAERRAIETRERIEAGLEGGGEGGAEGEEPLETEAEKARREAREQREREQIAARLQRLDEQYLAEEQALQLKFQRERELTEQAYAEGIILEEEYERRKTEINQREAAAREKLQATSEAAKRNIMSGSFAKMAGAMGGASKKMFRVQKAASLAQAAVALPAAVVDAIKNGGGLPWGAIPGAITLAAGIAQIASIKKQQFGGAGGKPPSVTSGGASASPGSIGRAAGVATGNLGSQFQAPESAQPSPTTVVNFNVTGDIVGDTAETVLGKMRTLIEDNDAVLFSSNSRQAAELVPTG